ncbi:MAG: flagellar hook-length control protein FliK, partial [Rhodospirillaceae bacterium]
FILGAGNGTQQTTDTARAHQPTATDRPHTTPQQVIDQIRVNITRAAKAGMDPVTIQLKPENLGRVEVKLEMSDDHKVRVTVTADSKETLQLLQQDSRGLERALNDAGLRTDSSNLHFNLRNDGDPQKAGDGKNGNQPSGNQASEQETANKDEGSEPQYDYAEAARARGGIDTFA